MQLIACHDKATIILAQATALACSLVIIANGLDIEVQPQFIRPQDANITFTCSGGHRNDRTLEKMFRMRLMRLDDDDQWTEMAVLRFDGTIEMTDAKATAVGRLGDVFDSYLAVTWSEAPDDVDGRYRCDAVALTSAGDVVKELSRDLNIKSLSTDPSLLLERLKNFEKRLVAKVNTTMYGAITSSNINQNLSQLDSKIGELKGYLDNHTAVAYTYRRQEEEEVRIIDWPEGEFTLLMPSNGCPLRPTGWMKSFKRMKAPAMDKFYPINVPLHVAYPHRKSGFIYRQYCTLRSSLLRTDPWPAGSYCISSTITETCPSGFKHTEAKTKILTDEGNFYIYYNSNNRQMHGTFSVWSTYFCCRHDGSAANPMELPVSHPFYLYRHGGFCQEVEGMDVTQDVFMMDTLEDPDYDKWDDANAGFRPDVTFKPYKEELCYYSKRRH